MPRDEAFPYLLKKVVLVIFLATLMAVFFVPDGGADGFSENTEGVFPEFGKGTVAVRIYSNYFCGPCRALEPDVEPVLRELVEDGQVRVTFIDIPTPRSIPYVHYFLYALNENNNMEYALKIRGILFDLAGKQGGAEEIRQSLAEKDIGVKPYDLTGVFERFNELLQADAVRSTPSVVIEEGGESRMHTGRGDILAALEKIGGGAE